MVTYWVRRGRLGALAVAALLGAVGPALAQGARLQLPAFEGLEKLAKETVDVTLDESMLQLAAGLLGSDPDGAGLKDLLRELRGIYVKHYAFDKPGQYARADVEGVRVQLSKAGWVRLVGVRSTADPDLDASDTEVFAWTDEKGVPGGLALVSVEPKEVTVVNIVGRIDLQKLRRLEGQFGIPKIDVPTVKPGEKPRE